MDELLEQFLIEGPELIQQASDDLLALERDPADAARLDSAFRAVHTLKGSVGVFDFAAMGTALHAAEDLLVGMRDGRVAVDRAVIDALLDCIGVCDGWLGAIARTGTLPNDAETESWRVTQSLSARRAGREGAAETRDEADLGWLPAFLERIPAADLAAHADHPCTALRYVPKGDCFFFGDDPMALIRALPGLIALDIAARESWKPDAIDPFACNLVIEALTVASVDEVKRILRLVSDQVVIADVAVADLPSAGDEPGLDEGVDDSDGAAKPGRVAASRTLRVDAARVDALADIAGELIVAKNGLAHLAKRAAEIDRQLARDLTDRQAEIERLVGDLHRAVMGVRMVPLAQTFRRLPRLVRETAGRLGKEIDFQIAGGDIEADKSIVDGLFDPLLHLLRNAVDHGIESADSRRTAGKAPVGRVTLEARRDGELITVTVADDGGGIDAARVREIAKRRTVATDAAIDAMDDSEIANLIFMPGFSTAAEVTEISGRGVGLDAVRTHVEALGGRVTATSRYGAGATVRLAIPQAIAITSIMTVRVGDERFGVPIDRVVETVRIPADRILPIRAGAAFVLRDRTLPLMRLSALLGLADRDRAGSDTKILVVTSGDDRIGLEVDGFAERMEVLLRPLTGLLAGMPGFLGATLLGDGRVMMVLNVPELIG